jgi:hypothetical protein
MVLIVFLEIQAKCKMACAKRQCKQKFWQQASQKAHLLLGMFEQLEGTRANIDHGQSGQQSNHLHHHTSIRNGENVPL